MMTKKVEQATKKGGVLEEYRGTAMDDEQKRKNLLQATKGFLKNKMRYGKKVDKSIANSNVAIITDVMEPCLSVRVVKGVIIWKTSKDYNVFIEVLRISFNYDHDHDLTNSTTNLLPKED